MLVHGADRRRYVRVGRTLKLGYKVIHSVGKYERSVSKDISGGGIKIPFKEKPMEGSTLDLELELTQESKKFKFHGKVIWVKTQAQDKDYPYIAGIEFLNVSTAVQTMLSNYMQYLNRRELIKGILSKEAHPWRKLRPKSRAKRH